MNIWQILEIEPSRDLAIIKQAYAKKIKTNKPEVNPAGFQLLRLAYELAQKYAAGLEINIELTEPALPASDSNPPIPKENNVNENNPITAANLVLDAITTNENDVMELLNTYKEKKLFDNLEFSDKFQQVLAINLLTYTPKYYYAICYIIEFFNWQDKLHHHDDDSMFMLAVRNLTNNAQPYYFLHRLFALNNIKNKREAKKYKVAWHECYAAKTLLRPGGWFKFYSLIVFHQRQTRAILSLHDTLQMSYPQIIGMGLNLKSMSWWSEYKTGKVAKRFLRIMFDFSILTYLSVFLVRYNLPSEKSVPTTPKTEFLMPLLSTDELREISSDIDKNKFSIYKKKIKLQYTNADTT